MKSHFYHKAYRVFCAVDWGVLEIFLHLCIYQPWKEKLVTRKYKCKSLQEKMANHSSNLAWRFPWTEELGRLQSVGLQRVRLNWTSEHMICNWKVPRPLWKYNYYKKFVRYHSFSHKVLIISCFPGGSVVKKPLISVGDTNSASDLGRSSGEGNGFLGVTQSWTWLRN